MKYILSGYCINCGRCQKACAVGAILHDGESFNIDQDKCVHCGACAKACRMGSITPEGYTAPKAEPHAEPIRYDCDLVVVGGGSSGLVAAAKVAESGKKVVILEKLGTLGGGGQYASGIRLFSTKWEKDAGIPDQLDDYVRSAMNTLRWERDPQLIYNAFKSLPEMFDWLCEWADVESCFCMGQSPFGGRSVSLKDMQKQTAGQFIAGALETKCRDLGVTILCNHSAKELIMQDGKAVGVIADDPGGETVISCRTCLLATGNISFGPVMERTIPEYYYMYARPSSHRLPSNTGDHISMAEKAGIPVDYDSVAAAYLGAMFLPMVGISGSIQSTRGEVLKVNKLGKRFINETWSDGEGPVWQQLHQPDGIAWAILDDKILSTPSLPAYNPPYDRTGRNIAAGVPDPDGTFKNQKAGPGGGPGGPWGMGAPKQSTRADMEAIAAKKGGHVFVAETIAQLAEKMGCDPAVLEATVARYNQLCHEGRDGDYFKPAKYMLPIEQGPFYAIHTHMATDGVFGGLDIDPHGSVMGRGGDPVEGLYASGDTIGNRYINPGGEKLEAINDFAWACCSGYLAAKSIGDYLG